ncbi:hypothetical protein BH18ACT12_BH18ACT12_22730 [soil metagenome]
MGWNRLWVPGERVQLGRRGGIGREQRGDAVPTLILC